MLHYIDQPPSQIFRYGKLTHYTEFMARGRFRLSMQHYYRREYEDKGSEFGDNAEGRVAHAFTQTGQRVTGTPWTVLEGGAYVVEQNVNAYILCFSKSYSIDSQYRWFRRRACYYDHCTAFDAKPFLNRLAQSIAFYYGPGELLAGSATYHSGVRDAVDFPLTRFCAFFSKRHTFEWEDEYRLVYLPHKKRRDLHIQVASLNSVDCIDGISSMYAHCA